MSFEERRSWTRVVVVLACAAGLTACGEDRGPTLLPGVNPGTNPAGSCNFESQGTCDEYSEKDSQQSTANACTSAGGTWSAGMCPAGARTGVCTDASSAATRTYSYTEAAAESLKGSCPANKFIEIKAGAGGRGQYAKGGNGGSTGGSGSAAGTGGASAGGSGGSTGASGSGGTGGSGGTSGGSGGASGSSAGRGGAGGAAGD
jgi:hypothetical protein